MAEPDCSIAYEIAQSFTNRAGISMLNATNCCGTEIVSCDRDKRITNLSHSLT